MPSYNIFTDSDASELVDISNRLQTAASAFNASHAGNEVEPEFIVVLKTMDFKNDENRQDFVTCLQNAGLVGSDPTYWSWKYEWDDVRDNKHISTYSVLLDDEFSIELCVETDLETGEKSVMKHDMSSLIKSLFSGFRKVTDKYGIPIDTSYNMFLEMFDKGMFSNK